MSELNAHISTCDSCREFLWSLGQVSVQVMPLLAENGAPAADIVPPEVCAIGPVTDCFGGVGQRNQGRAAPAPVSSRKATVFNVWGRTGWKTT